MEVLYMNRLFREEIEAVSNPYFNKYSKNSIRLNLMESPFCIDINNNKSPYENINLNRYPEPNLRSLKKIIKKTYKISDSSEVMFSNGLMQMIQQLCWAFSHPTKNCLIVEPSFFMFKRFIRQAHMNVISVALKSDFQLDLDKILMLISEKNPVLIFLDYPNNPTGVLFDEKSVEEIIKKCNGIVVIDEAYYPYSEKTWVDKVRNFDNLIVIRSFSKCGFAGIRLGYLVAQKRIVQYLEKAAPPFSVNMLTEQVAFAFLSHWDKIIQHVEDVNRLKQELFSDLRKIKGIQPFPSKANFILFKIDNISPKYVFDFLAENNIHINILDGTHNLLQGCLRVAVGDRSSNKKFIVALQKSMKSNHY